MSRVKVLEDALRDLIAGGSPIDAEKVLQETTPSDSVSAEQKTLGDASPEREPEILLHTDERGRAIGQENILRVNASHSPSKEDET